jgi:hypothetical protein
MGDCMASMAILLYLRVNLSVYLLHLHKLLQTDQPEPVLCVQNC